MRNLLLASAAILSATAGMAHAQNSLASPGVERAAPPLLPQGGAGAITSAPVSAVGANNNNNVAARALPGGTMNPAPGTFVVRLGGRATVVGGGGWSSTDNFSTPAVAAVAGPFTLNPATGAVTNAAGKAPAAAIAANNSKVQPYMLNTYARLYPGLDAMATNGLRYGAGMEIRMNSTSAVSTSAGALGGSSNTSGQTLFVRRAFGYLAAENAGILRVGEGDGVIGLFDGGQTTGQNFSVSGVLNGGDGVAMLLPPVQIPFAWLSLAGNEYGTAKLVYLSPRYFGFTAGLGYVPTQTNGYDNSSGFPGSYGAPSCSSAAGIAAGGSGNSGCATLSSSSALTDANRYRDLYQAGIRYNEDFGPVNLLAYGAYYGSGRVSYTGAPGLIVANGGNAGSSGNYHNLSIGSFGTAVTFAGLTFGVNYLTGQMNSQLALNPAGAPAMNAVTASVQYVVGALTVGGTYGQIDSQGSNALVGTSQRHESEFDIGGSYKVAPGLTAYADYYYAQRHQGNYNFQTGATRTAAYNDVHGQSVLLGISVNW